MRNNATGLKNYTQTASWAARPKLCYGPKGDKPRLATWFCFVIFTALLLKAVRAQNTDDNLKVYAVSVMNVIPFQRHISGFGIYIGNGAFITAAHVVGRWSNFVNPRLLIADQELPAKVIKKGSFEQTDLAMLSVDETLLPVSLLLRRNPLCKGPLVAGAKIIVVYPERTVLSHIISPLKTFSEDQTRFSSLINDVQVSGSGVFDAERKCFLGIMSASVSTHDYRGDWACGIFCAGVQNSRLPPR